MLQPVNLQLAHFNLEHSAQISKDAIAAAQQTAQGQEVVQESVKRTQMVQAGLAAAEAQKVKRREEEDEQERRRGEQRQSFSDSHRSSREAGTRDMEENAPEEKRRAPKGFDLYA
ncbi:MAG: hypothetical protein LBT65_02005 [Synergistaceae bacterium]|jgi:hypothetical protein|nr:hypothetical protein [Synergistaceae bacterium]